MTASRNDQPYQNNREYLLDELRRIDLLLQRRVKQWRAERGESPNEFAGYYISDEKIDQLLQSTVTDSSFERINEGHLEHADRRTDINRLAKRINERKQATPEQKTKLRLAALKERFALGDEGEELARKKLDVFLLAVAPEFDPKYEMVYAYLHDDLTKTRPSVDLILRTLFVSPTKRLDGRTLVSRTSQLRQNGLIRLIGGEERVLSTQPVMVDERVVDYLLESDAIDGSLGGFVELIEPNRRLDKLILDEKVKTQLEHLARRNGLSSDGEPTENFIAYFHGPYGSGKTEAVEALCAEEKRPVLKADAKALVAAGVRDGVELLIREARLQGADLFVSNLNSVDGKSDADIDLLLRELDRFKSRVFLMGEEPLGASRRLGVNEHAFVMVHFPVPSYRVRRELWKAVKSLPDEVDTADLAGKFRLTGGQIEDAVEIAKSLSYGTELDTDDIYAGCRIQSREKLSTLGSIVEPNYKWDDIVLPDDKEEQLREVAAHIEYQGRVYANWGFEQKFSLGNGLVALFTGPSGTGKTMAAEIIANDAKMDLYKIDLSNVISKYIGETEKNLGEVFDEAENSNAILFFDEADALFGKRSEVSDAHDRYANIEVNYLLQRVEEHDGTVILTTNFKKNIDDAFLRRIHLSVDFPLPDREARERIWRGVFPAETPLGRLDYVFLSTFDLTGGNIKNIALTAAFLAASETWEEPKQNYREETERIYREVRGTVRELVPEDEKTNDDPNLDFLNRVEMEHVIRATRREFQKTGTLIKPETFGEYRDLLRND